MDKSVFLDLMETLPAPLPQPLHRARPAAGGHDPQGPAGRSGKQLQGNLKFFDLATVIQTLIGSHQTGSLVVTQEGGKHKIAEIFFFKGNIARARYKQLAGDDAVFQLFQSPLEGEFAFTGRQVQEDEVQTDISMPAISLLMESVRLQDELPGAQGAASRTPIASSTRRRPSSSGRTRRRWSWRPRSGRG